MRRLLLCTALVSMTMPGCQFFSNKREASAPPLKVAPPPPVRAEDVNAANAHEKIRVLSDELDRDIDGEDVK
jgi:hypothetical protein